MIIRSTGTQNNDFDKRCKIDTTVIYLRRQSTDIPAFETRPEDKNDEVFYELPRTYPIVSGYHTSTAAGDTAQTNAQANRKNIANGARKRAKIPEFIKNRPKIERRSLGGRSDLSGMP